MHDAEAVSIATLLKDSAADRVRLKGRLLDIGSATMAAWLMVAVMYKADNPRCCGMTPVGFSDGVSRNNRCLCLA